MIVHFIQGYTNEPGIGFKDQPVRPYGAGRAICRFHHFQIFDNRVHDVLVSDSEYKKSIHQGVVK
jgi:hypothetical protein